MIYKKGKWHIFNGYILLGTSGRGTCSCRRSREVTRSTTLSLSTGPTARWTSYHQLLHCPSNQTVVKSKHSCLHMLGLNGLPWSELELIRLQDTLTFCTPRPWHKCASGHPIWICLNLKLGVAMLGKEGSFENDLIHSDWHFASIDKMHIISKFHTLQTVTYWEAVIYVLADFVR